jgi:multidrug efflux system outer membrane protein
MKIQGFTAEQHARLGDYVVWDTKTGGPRALTRDDIGESMANFLPRIGLTSFYGRQSAELSQLLESGSLAWAASGALTGPIFQGGRNWYLFKASKAERDAALRGYEQSVLVALQEVSDAQVSGCRRSRGTRRAPSRPTRSRCAFRRSGLGIRELLRGVDSVSCFSAENRFAHRLGRLLALAVYKASGGGWSSTSPPPQARLPTLPSLEPP